MGHKGCPRGQNFIFSNMVMWHIQSTGMTSITECKSKFNPRVKLVTLGRGQKVNYNYILATVSISMILYQLCDCVLTKK